MSQKQGGGGGATGCLIVALAVILLVVCGGGTVAMIGVMFFARVSHDVQVQPPAPPAELAVSGTLVVQADGKLLWNNVPIEQTDLSKRLDELKSLPPPRPTIIIRLEPGTSAETRRQITQLFADRELSFLLEGP
jgi:biopolymer transport protein ExbD